MGSPFLSLSLITYVSFVPNPVALVSMDTSSQRLCVGSSLRPVFFSPLREYRTFGEVMWNGVSRLWVPTLPSSVTMPPPQSFGAMDALKALCMPGERSIPTTSSARVPHPCVVLAEQEEECFSLFSSHEWELSDSLNTVGGKFRALEGTYIPPPCISVFFAPETL